MIENESSSAQRICRFPITETMTPYEWYDSRSLMWILVGRLINHFQTNSYGRQRETMIEYESRLIQRICRFSNTETITTCESRSIRWNLIGILIYELQSNSYGRQIEIMIENESRWAETICIFSNTETMSEFDSRFVRWSVFSRQINLLQTHTYT